MYVDKWKNGDKCISDNNYSIKVSDIFIDNKLSIFHKENYPIVKYLDKIIWIPNLYRSNIFNLDNGSNEFFSFKWNVNL